MALGLGLLAAAISFAGMTLSSSIAKTNTVEFPMMSTTSVSLLPSEIPRLIPSNCVNITSTSPSSRTPHLSPSSYVNIVPTSPSSRTPHLIPSSDTKATNSHSIVSRPQARTSIRERMTVHILPHIPDASPSMTILERTHAEFLACVRVNKKD